MDWVHNVFGLRIATSPMNKPFILTEEKIYIASKNLYKFIFINKKINYKTELAYKKYANRSCYRTTPFGLFTSTDLLTFPSEVNSNKQEIILDTLLFSRSISFDSIWFSKLIDENENSIGNNFLVKWNSDVVYSSPRYYFNSWSTKKIFL